MAQDFTVNVDFAVLRDAAGKPKTVLAWGDPVRMVKRDDERIEVETVDFVESGGGLQAVKTSGFLDAPDPPARQGPRGRPSRRAGAGAARLVRRRPAGRRHADPDAQGPGDHDRRRREQAVRALPRQPPARLLGPGPAGDRRDGRHARRRRPLLGPAGDPGVGDEQGPGQAAVRASEARVPQRPGEAAGQGAAARAARRDGEGRRGHRDHRPGGGPARRPRQRDERRVQGVEARARGLAGERRPDRDPAPGEGRRRRVRLPRRRAAPVSRCWGRSRER